MLYKIKTGTTIAGISSLCIVGAIIVTANSSESDFLYWGPSNVKFAGFKIDTWGKWNIVMCYSIFSQLSESIISATISPYISNVIRDHKTPLSQKGNKFKVHGIILIYTVYKWLTSIFDIFLWITLQAQFMAPAILIDLISTIYFTNSYMKIENNNLLD